jgi:predicted metal-dependent enzyme (double-stranded beta helix superfamily)
MAEPDRLIDLDHATGAGGLEDGVPSVNQLSHTDRMVADFMARARELLAAGVTEDTLQAVGRLLADASTEPGFVTEGEMRRLHGSESSFAILQSDPDGLTLMLSRFSPEAETPVHDHDSWGVACVVRGRDRYKHWQLEPDGHVRVLYETELDAGSFVTWLGPPNDIHSQQGIDGDAMELVMFGKNVTVIPRNYNNPETGEVVRTSLPH